MHLLTSTLSPSLIILVKDQLTWLDRKGLLDGTFEWAYSATKTRTVSLDLDEADAAGATLLVRTEASHVHTSADGGEVQLREESMLPAGVRRGVRELGVMVRLKIE